MTSSRALWLLSALVTQIALAVWLIALALLACADTAGGRWMALLFLSLAPALLSTPLSPAPPERRPRWPIALLPVAAISLLLAARAAPPAWPDPAAPPALPPADGGLHALWLRPPDPRAISSLTPERDQITLATYLLPPFDPMLTFQSAAPLRAAARSIYAEIDADPRWRQGSVQKLAYDELWGLGAGHGHAWVVMPAAHPDAPAAPRPAIVFLHGFGGNLQAYLRVLAPAAQRHGYAIVAPTFGAGLWYNRDGPDGSRAALSAILQWMRGSQGFDMDRIVLAGLSNGGFGVYEALSAYPDQWSAVAWLSAIQDPAWADTLAAARAPSGAPPPQLVLHGGAEDRIPLEYIAESVQAAQASGAQPRLDVVEGADHFLMFTHRARVEAALDRLLEGVSADSSLRTTEIQRSTEDTEDIRR